MFLLGQTVDGGHGVGFLTWEQHLPLGCQQVFFCDIARVQSPSHVSCWKNVHLCLKTGGRESNNQFTGPGFQQIFAPRNYLHAEQILSLKKSVTRNVYFMKKINQCFMLATLLSLEFIVLILYISIYYYLNYYNLSNH